MSTRLVERAAGVLGRRTSRRGFIRRSALVGSALAVAPTAYTLRPGTAYAQICNFPNRAGAITQPCPCGSACGDGWTEFCCTMYPASGNRCPPGSITGGWWKADGSGFCDNGSPQPRYYLDCHSPAGAPYRCGCAPDGAPPGVGVPGNCNNRAAGCNFFRYGQCNQNISVMGPIICRVVTCIPPWRWDPTCSTAMRVDNRTAFHNKPCALADRGAPFGNLRAVTVVPGQVTVTGYVEGAAPPTVRITAGSVVLGQITADKTAAQVGQAPVGFTNVRWFQASFPVTAGPQLIAAYVMDLVPQQDGTTEQVPRMLGVQNVVVPDASPFGNIDMVVTRPGRVTLAGWAIDPDAGPPDIHVYVDGAFAGGTTADRPRADVNAAYPTFPGPHGFALDLRLDVTRSRRVAVYAINAGAGSNTLIGTRTVLPPTGPPIGFVDNVSPAPDGFVVTGWALDPDGTAPLTVRARVDGGPPTSTVANRPRADVGAVFPGWGEARGFAMFVPAAVGTRRVCVEAVGLQGESSSLGCTTAEVTSSLPRGNVDVVAATPGNVRVAGWTFDPDAPTAVVNVHVYVDGAFAGGVGASRHRADVGAAFPAAGPLHGFDLTLPTAAGARRVCVFAIDHGGSAARQLACVTVDVPPA